VAAPRLPGTIQPARPASIVQSLLHLLLIAAAVYAGLILLLLLFEKKLVYFPGHPGRETGDWQPAGLPVEDVRLVAEDGVALHAWWIPVPDGEFTFLAFHGNAGNVAHRAPVYRFLHSLPANVLAVEYRGYGRSEGAPDEPGIYRDARAGWEHLVRKRGIAPERIIAFGQSLGTAVAADLAAERTVGGIVLESPFPSAREVARRVYPFLPGIGYFLRTKFEIAAKLETGGVPLLVVHCAQDPVINFALGEETFRRAGEPKRLFRVNGYCHEEASRLAPEEYRQALTSFLTSILRQQ
jgi:fermentation-respiration switch protein FrsA (DUF1100 family)